MSEGNTHLLTVEQVAEYCQLSQSTIYHWLCDGKLKHVKLGTAVRIRRQDLDRFVLQRVQPKGNGSNGSGESPAA
jgi:excisionase family DNA binding protein